MKCFSKGLFVLICLAMLFLVGCQTVFIGDSHIPGGVQGCEAKCGEQGLELAGMVMLGEYTDGCICAVPGYEQQAMDAAGAVTGGAVGVIMQMREQQQQQSHQQPHHHVHK